MFSFGFLNLERLQSVSWLLYTALSLVLAGDMSIAAILCTLLFRSRTGMGNTDPIINVLLMYTINSGLLTSVVAAIVVFTVSSNWIVLLHSSLSNHSTMKVRCDAHKLCFSWRLLPSE
jgi:hypothetical protein